jgi:hypothetical protein
MGRVSIEEGGQSYFIRKSIVFAAYSMLHTLLRNRELNIQEMYNTSDMNAKCVKVFDWENRREIFVWRHRLRQRDNTKII